jgi:hypothetical protein
MAGDNPLSSHRSFLQKNRFDYEVGPLKFPAFPPWVIVVYRCVSFSVTRHRTSGPESAFARDCGSVNAPVGSILQSSSLARVGGFEGAA